MVHSVVIAWISVRVFGVSSIPYGGPEYSPRCWEIAASASPPRNVRE